MQASPRPANIAQVPITDCTNCYASNHGIQLCPNPCTSCNPPCGQVLAQCPAYLGARARQREARVRGESLSLTEAFRMYHANAAHALIVRQPHTPSVPSVTTTAPPHMPGRSTSAASAVGSSYGGYNSDDSYDDWLLGSSSRNLGDIHKYNFNMN